MSMPAAHRAATNHFELPELAFDIFPHLLQVLIADFFFILVVLGWLVAGVGLKTTTGASFLVDAWMPLWPFVFQPAIGVLMAGALVSGGWGWLKDKVKQQ